MDNINANWDPGFAAGLADSITADLDSTQEAANLEDNGGIDPASFEL